MDIKKLFGRRIKELRKSRNLTQEQLAEMLDISQNAMSYIETGENFISAETLQKLLLAFQIDIEELFKIKHLQGNTEMLNEIIKILNAHPDKIQQVYKITKALIN